MSTAAKPQTREEAFFRSLRPPELRDAPDEWYDAVVREARRVAAADQLIQTLRYSIRRARVSIERGAWPRLYWLDHDGEVTTDRPTILTSDPVTVCWLVETQTREEHGFALLYDLDDYVRASGGWNDAFGWGLRGSIRRWAYYGLVYRVAPVRWAVTDVGRELLDLVFGDGS